jgi:hypothetical protein
VAPDAVDGCGVPGSAPPAWPAYRR